VVFLHNKAERILLMTLGVSGPQPALAGRLGLGSHAAHGVMQGIKVKHGSVTMRHASTYPYLYLRYLDRGVTLLKQWCKNKENCSG